MSRSREITEHWARVRDLGCIVSHRTDAVTLHHCHSGSMTRFGLLRGTGQKVSDWLVIPLDAEYHTGSRGIDAGQGGLTLLDWEALYGTQVEHLDEVCERLGYSVWEKAGINRWAI